MKDSSDLFLRVKKEDLYLLCPFLESFEGLAAVRTPAPGAGEFATIKLMVSPDFTADLDRVLISLSKRVQFERILGQN